MKHIIISLLMILMLFFVSCSATNKENQPTDMESETTQNNQSSDNVQPSYKKLEQSKAKQWIDETEDVIILDVREQEEFDDGHIKGAILAPVGKIENEIEHITNDKDALILIYCRSGNRSADAANILGDLGYSNVYDFGGIITWEYGIEQ